MADIDNDIVSTLTKKIDDQGRFTRIVTVLCCLAIVGCLSYAMSAVVSAMPDLILAKLMSRMEAIHSEWKTIEKLSTDKKIEPAQ